MSVLTSELIDSIPTKLCSECRRQIAIWDFGMDRSKAGGLNRACKTCVRERIETKRQQHKLRKLFASKVCRTCKADKPVGEFSPLPTNPDGLLAHCHSCNAAQQRDRRAGNGARELSERRIIPFERETVKEPDPFERSVSIAQLATKLMGASGTYKRAWRIN